VADPQPPRRRRSRRPHRPAGRRSPLARPVRRRRTRQDPPGRRGTRLVRPLPAAAPSARRRPLEGAVDRGSPVEHRRMGGMGHRPVPADRHRRRPVRHRHRRRMRHRRRRHRLARRTLPLRPRRHRRSPAAARLRHGRLFDAGPPPRLGPPGHPRVQRVGLRRDLRRGQLRRRPRRDEPAGHRRRHRPRQAPRVPRQGQQLRIHHIGKFPVLEQEQLSWRPDSRWSPNRLDALVWDFHDLRLTGGTRVRVLA
jgi:hypothetical protein